MFSGLVSVVKMTKFVLVANATRMTGLLVVFNVVKMTDLVIVVNVVIGVLIGCVHCGKK